MIPSLLAEISDLETIFLTQKCAKANFNRELTLDIQMYFKEMETFQYLNFHSCHSPGTKRGFLRGEVQCLPWINLSHFMFNKNMWCFKICLKNRGYQDGIFEKCSAEFDCTRRDGLLQNWHGIRLSIDGIVSLSNSHPSAEKSFLFDFPLKFCAAGPLQTQCSFFWPNPEAD